MYRRERIVLVVAAVAIAALIAYVAYVLLTSQAPAPPIVPPPTTPPPTPPATPPGWAHAACPDLPDQAKAYGVRARCGL